MLKYLVLIAFLILLPGTSWAQHGIAVLDYSALTDSIITRWKVEIWLDSVHKHHFAKGERMVKRFEQQYVRAQKRISGGCITPEQQNKLVRRLEKMQQEIVDYEERIFKTAIPALDSNLNAYLEDLTPQFIRNYMADQPALKLFDKNSLVYHHPDVPDLTQEILAYIESQRVHRKRFNLYAASKVVSLGLNLPSGASNR
mgnify:CR=1 FL=1